MDVVLKFALAELVHELCDCSNDPATPEEYKLRCVLVVNTYCAMGI